MGSVDIKTRLPSDLKDRLYALSRSSKRSLSELAIEAVGRLADRDDDEVGHISRALEVSRKPDARIIPHKQAMERVRVRGVSASIPRPRQGIRIWQKHCHPERRRP